MFGFKWTKSILFSLALVVAAASSLPAEASTGYRKKNFFYNQHSVSIYGNSGGSIGTFARQSLYYKSSHTKLRFTGRCDSACTLFLALPRSQTCLSAGAVFRFHSPIANNSRMASLAHRYMMAKYPPWVRSYIKRSGGLTHRLITMDSRYASRYMSRCV